MRAFAIGLLTALLAYSLSLEGFSLKWWVFIIAMNTLAVVSGGRKS